MKHEHQEHWIEIDARTAERSPGRGRASRLALWASLLVPACVVTDGEGDPEGFGLRATAQGLWIVDADANTDVRMLIDGETLYADQLPSNWTLRSEHADSPAQVCFDLDGVRERCEGVAPFAIAGDTSGNYNAWDPGLGSHTVDVITDGGSPLSVDFTLEATSGVACDNGVLDGSETDVDCGGSCSPCGTGDDCSSNADCASGSCSGGVCEAPPPLGDCEVLGELRRWHRVEVRCTGPAGSEADDATFTDYRMNVTFDDGSTSLVVPGHFAADGNAANTGSSAGNRWRAYFMPPSTGSWDYTVSMRSGANVAVSTSAGAGSPVAGLDGAQGSFSVAASNKSGRDMRAHGLLEHASDERYLRFAGSGELFVEGGVDSPENLFGYDDFDDTVKYANVGSCKGILHQFEPHLSDWNAGDPSWDGGRGKSLVGLVNYVASTGVNAMYLVPMSVNGDGCDGHPWSDYFGNRRAFDVSRLDQWELVFGHMSAKGLLIHYVTQETENDQLLNGGALGLERKLYYREIISRFGHHPALQWNLGEENTNTTAQQKAFADFIKASDPYDHPVVMHTYPGDHGKYDALEGHATFDGPTLQYGSIPESAAGGLYGETLDFIADSTAAGRTWVVTATEASGGDAPTPNTSVSRRQRVFWMWANVMAGGGGFEWYLKNAGAGHAYDLAVEDLREFDAHWQQSGHLVEFFRDVVQGDGVDLLALQPNNGLTSISTDWVLADPGEAYVLFLRDGGAVSLAVSGGGTYQVDWFDPRTGSLTARPDIGGTGTKNLGSPPSGATQDWVVFVRR